MNSDVLNTKYVENLCYTIDENGYRSFDNMVHLRIAINRAVAELEYAMNDDNFWPCVFSRVFGGCPHGMSLCKDGSFMNPLADDLRKIKNQSERKELSKKVYTLDTRIKYWHTMNKIAETYKDECIVFRNDSAHIVTNDFIVYKDRWNNDFVLAKTSEYPKKLRECIVKEEDSEYGTFEYVISSRNGFQTQTLNIRHNDVDVKKHYNDDLPHQEILDFIESDESGLLLFHGVPGTGKSTYIRYLIETCSDITNFLVLDQSVFGCITDASFVSLLLNNPNSVVILEDCESMIREREHNNDNRISTLLNLTDGILGDSFHLKFICTFNTEIRNIDKALLRKGRMKMKYEFGLLKADKAKALADELGVKLEKSGDIALTDVFNAETDNGTQRIIRKTVGFVPVSEPRPIGEYVEMER